MNTYLMIMATILVATQVIRITQNAIQLYRKGHDIEIQRAVFLMLYNRLTAEAQAKLGQRRTYNERFDSQNEDARIMCRVRRED